MKKKRTVSLVAQRPSIKLLGGYKKATPKKTKKPARYVGVKKKNANGYKVPKTPKVSGRKWGG